MPLVVQAIARAGERESAATEIRALMDATFDVITTTGSFDPQIREILTRTELSRQVFDRHFESKDELLLVVFEESWPLVGGYLIKRIARAEGAEAHLWAWIEGRDGTGRGSRCQPADPPVRHHRPRLEARFPNEYAEARRALVGALADVIADRVAGSVFDDRRPKTTQ